MKNLITKKGFLFFIFVLGLNIGAFAQQVPTVFITGTVINADFDEPMVGVSILVVGTIRGTTTDLNGNFKIDAFVGDTLLFTYIGMKPFKVVVYSGLSNLKIYMHWNTPVIEDRTAYDSIVIRKNLLFYVKREEERNCIV